VLARAILVAISVSDSVGMLIFAAAAIGDGAVLWRWVLSISSQKAARLLHPTIGVKMQQ